MIYRTIHLLARIKHTSVLRAQEVLLYFIAHPSNKLFSCNQQFRNQFKHYTYM